jgi:hypothetical protein
MNYQSQQAIRVFFSRNLLDEDTSTTKATRYVYGPLAVLQSTGAHPSKHYKVFPFSEQLSTIVNQLSLLLKNNGVIVDVEDFNFLEVKVYLGDDIFMDDNGEVITDITNKPLVLGSNKVVNSHNDIRFSDKGVQSENDTTQGDQPTVTVTVGSTRTIIFEHYVKESGDKAWTRCATKKDEHIELDHGSVFVLLPQDEKPTKIRGYATMLHKTKHRVEFQNTGVSFAFVFRCVQKTSKFDPLTHRWLWELESDETKNTVKKYLDKLESKNYIHSTKENENEMRMLDINVFNYVLHRWKRRPTNDLDE